jgi:hypothetical protein
MVPNKVGLTSVCTRDLTEATVFSSEAGRGRSSSPGPTASTSSNPRVSSSPWPSPTWIEEGECRYRGIAYCGDRETTTHNGNRLRMGCGVQLRCKRP